MKTISVTTRHYLPPIGGAKILVQYFKGGNLKTHTVRASEDRAHEAALAAVFGEKVVNLQNVQQMGSGALLHTWEVFA